MEIKPKLLELVRQAEASEQEFITSLTPTQQAEQGTFQRWSAKDSLAHVAAWNQNLVFRYQAFATGQVLPPVDDDAANAEIFAQNEHIPWDQVLATVAAVRAGIRELVSSLGEDALLDPGLSPWQKGRPAWMDIAGTVYTHPLLHRGQYFSKREQPEQALQMQIAAADQLIQVDDTPTWRGTVLYNLACAYAIAGETEKALAFLREGLKLSPDLKPWSREDPDLVSLHTAPAFVQITGE